MMAALQEIFGNAPAEREGKFEISFGALKRLTVWPGRDGKSLCIESESLTDTPDRVIIDTNRRFREYLERVTGYTAKERIRMAKKKVED